MVFALYTLKDRYKNRRKYIWNINRDSIGIFTKAAFSRIDIRGFLVYDKAKTNEEYMNRPIISLEEIREDNEVIILLADAVPESVINLLPDGKAIYWSDSLEINSRLCQEKIIVYGIGNGSFQLKKKFAVDGIVPELYCVTKREDIMQYEGKKVIEAEQLGEYQDYSVVVSVTNKQFYDEILDILVDFQGSIYVDIEHIIAPVSMINLMQSLEYAVKKHRKVYLYSKKDIIAELIESILVFYNIRVNGYVYDREDETQDIKSIYELAFEGIADKLIIINERRPENMLKARKNVELAGFSLEELNYTGLQYYTYSDEWLMSKIQMVHDALVGDSMLYSHGLPGWRLYGKDGDGRIRILVLGGSTSSEVFYPENWISKLYYKLEQRNIKTVIYNGAHCGDDIVDEILRLLRDGHVLRPQIVISMSGVNNLRYKRSVNQFNEERIIGWMKALTPDGEYCGGVCDEETLYSFWSRNVGLLKVLVEFYGGKFLGFLQPMNMTMKSMTSWEKSLYEEEGHMVGAEEFSCFANDEEGYINLMHLFEHQDGMYLDVCHYTAKAQEIIADKVFEAIESVLWSI